MAIGIDTGVVSPSDTYYNKDFVEIEDITINEGSYNGCILTEGIPVNVGEPVGVNGSLQLLDINGNLLTPDIYIESFFDLE